MTIPPPAPRTARTILVDWANAQGHWVRTLTNDVLASRRPVPSERVADIYSQFLVEKDLQSGNVETVPPLEGAIAAAESVETLSLLKLDAVENVNALTAGQAITFNAGLTIVFGKNGAGKSGYVRILKRVARVRAVESVLPNVLVPPSARGPQRATLTYQLGNLQQSLDWKGEEGVHPLTRLDVFDARAISLHLDEDLTYVYTPSDLALFGYVNDAIEKIRSRLDEDVKASTPTANPFVSKIQRDTRVYQKVESLGAATDIAELEQLAVVTQTEIDGIDGLRERVNALRPESSSDRVLQADSERSFLEHALSACNTVSGFDHVAYEAARGRIATAEQRYRVATETAFAGQDIPGALGEAWKAFVTAGDSYRAANGLDQYPGTGDKCLYCRQDLAATALDLLQKYKDYCNNQLKKEVDASRAALDDASRALIRHDLAPLIGELSRREQLVQGEPPPLLAKVATLVAAVRSAQGAARQGHTIDAPTYVGLVRDLMPTLQTQLDDATQLVGRLRGQADERKRAHAEESAKLRELEARVTLRDLLDEIRKVVTSAKWANKAQTLSARFRPLLKSLTESVKLASEGLLNADFERLFRAECDVLRAPSVRLDFPGRKGQPARRKVLVADHKLSDILSEGEQKVIALADFLAEAQLKASPNPIVFDDPVTSLDYERMGEVVDRIGRLSAKRQVVVFTHNIWFAIELVNKFENDRTKCSYFDIAQDDAGRCGIVSGGTNPRADSMSTVAGRLNKAINEAKTLTGEPQAALIESGYEHLRTWCEVVVEVELLQKVVQRYQPNVMMGALDRIKSQALGPAIATINPIFERACRFIRGHSQPLETLNVRPSLADLEKDWAAVQAALKIYKAA
jgi:ABC-type transport system involved in cytochrome c biogenesis ATPase subunit